MAIQDKSFVIAIAGAAGSGKTELVNAVTSLLDNAVSFYFDDYESTHQIPEDIRLWLAGGVDPHQWRSPRLLADLRLLSHGTAVVPPDSNRTVEPASVIVMEEPFGRTREHMEELVDFVACIDLPLEHALARSVLRKLDGVSQEQTSEECLEELRGQLQWYLESGRDVYYGVNEHVKKECQLVLDGRRPVAELAQEIVDNVSCHLVPGLTDCETDSACTGHKG